ncbi:hypothetical protein [Ammoniphilus resinae]|uniref:Uncharacterized protein n=1 Tax=Ammoniphilus resinae TaxID=861532 RepID=A0ABS4GWM8_9BACL|nr:hypothetical protein [Ammoniphilus resinae]MBP1934688.1 hypothetical protein [Ammoniphilus resinae]
MGIRNRSNRFQVSGSVGGDSTLNISPGGVTFFQRITASIPAESSLVIKRTRFFFLDDLRLFVDTFPSGAGYVSQSNFNEEIPNSTIYTNNSNLPQLLRIFIGSTNTNALMLNANPSDGWWIEFSIE